MAKPSELKMNEGETAPPKHLTEADLITKMNNNGIGTDATIHEHIKNVQEREYARKQNTYLVPTRLGQSLVEVYSELGIELHKPYLRAAMESDMKEIADGVRSKNDVYKECIQEMRKIFVKTYGYAPKFQQFFRERFRNNANN